MGKDVSPLIRDEFYNVVEKIGLGRFPRQLSFDILESAAFETELEIKKKAKVLFEKSFGHA